MQVTSMKVGDLFPRPRLRLQADGVGVDLSEAVSVTARVRLPGSTSHVDRDVTVADQDVTANHGIVTVVLIDGDTDFQGTIKFDIEVEWATGVQTWPSRGYFKIWLLEDADSAQGGGPPLVGSSGDPFTLDRIYDVNISSVADNDLLQYDSTSARWLNVAPADVRSTLGLGSAALSSSTDFIRSSVTQAGAALTPTAQTLWSFQPADTNRGPFQWVMGGAAFDSVFDPVMYLGYNVTDGGGVAKSGEASFRTALESHYRNGGVNNFEYYFEYMSGDLVTRRRPFFLQMDKSTGAVNSMQFSANTAYFTQESDEAPYFTISRGNITSAPYAGTPIEWRIKAASAQNSVFTMENSTSVALTVETLSANSAVLRAGSIANENLYLFDNRGIAVNVQDNAAALTVKGGAVGPVAVFRAGSVAGNLTTWQDNASSVLASVSSAGLATFAGLTLSDATNMAFGTTTGTKIGTATSQKLGFYNATPIIRPSGSILTALSSLGLVGSPTLASTALSDTATLAYLNAANTFTAAQTIRNATYAKILLDGGSTSGNGPLIEFTSAGNSGELYGYMGRDGAINGGTGTDLLLYSVYGLKVQRGSTTLARFGSASNTFTAFSASAVPVIAKGAAAQDADFLTVQNSAGTKLGGWDKYGQLNTQYLTDITGVSPYLRLQSTSLIAINQGNAANVAFAVRGMAAQTGALTLWQDSASATLASVSAAGLGSFDSLKIIGSGTNTGIGYLSHASTSGMYNTSLGYLAQRFVSTGSYNTAIGPQSNYNNASGTAVTAVGYGAALGVSANSHTGGTYLGYFAGNGVTTGAYNIALGYYAGAYSTSQSYELFINSIDRTNRAGDIAGSIIYGVQNATAASQTLTLNAAVTAVYGLTSNAATSIVGVADVSQLTVKGASGQSNSIQEWQNNSGTVLTRVGSSGFIGTQGGFGHNTAGQPYILPASGSLTALSQNAAHVAWTVKGAVSQSANLQTWEDSSSTVLASISAAGAIKGASIGPVTGTLNILDSTSSIVAQARTTDFNVNYRLIAGATTGTEAFRTLGNSLLTVSNAAHIPLQVRGFTSQSANLQTWENSAGTVLLSVNSDGALVGGSPVSVKLWNRTVQGTGGGSLIIGGSATGSATDGVVIDGNATTFSTGVTSGEWSSLRVGQNNNPNASSTAIHNTILVNPTINYASGGAGSYNALRIKVTETALPSGANYLIYASAGAAGTTEKFSITNAGLGTFAGGVSLADASDLTIGTTTGSKIGQASSKIGFFNATPVAKPTGVAVDAASIHAALVSLGLISA